MFGPEEDNVGMSFTQQAADEDYFDFPDAAKSKSSSSWCLFDAFPFKDGDDGTTF